MTPDQHKYLASTPLRYIEVSRVDLRPGDLFITFQMESSEISCVRMTRLDQVEVRPRMIEVRTGEERFKLRRGTSPILCPPANMIGRTFQGYKITGQRHLSPQRGESHLLVILAQKQDLDPWGVWATAIYDSRLEEFSSAEFDQTYQAAVEDFGRQK